MPFNCRVCSNSDFSEIDGLYYCTECQTQSEDFILQESSQTNYHCTGSNEIRLSQTQNQSSRKKPKLNLGRPWTIYEAYQIIILAQADSLIAQGASVDLKDVVYTIWANYLAHLGVAFCRYEKLVPDYVAKTKHGRFRELYRGTLNNPQTRKKRPFIEDQRSSKITADGNGSVYEGDKADDYKKDNILFLNDYPKDDMKMSLKKSKHRMVHYSPEWMNMSKTLAICYIGLMFTNPNFLPCDVVRFVYDSKVPFLSVTHLLPTDMVLSGYDRLLFDSPRLDSKSLIIEVNRLLAYLTLDKMKLPDLTVLVRRFVQELCLPGEFTTYCFNLMEKVPFMWTYTAKPGYYRQELVAMGYIILALKVALGLDDTTELKLSRYSHKLQGLLASEVKLFVWSDWKKFMMRKSTDEFSGYVELTSEVCKSRLQHLDELLDCYSKTESDKRKYATWRLTNRHCNLRRSVQPEFRKSMRKPLEIALERLQDHGDLKQDAAHRNKEDLASKSQEFQCCTMKHIVDISGFQEQFQSILSENKDRFDKLMERFSLPRTEILQYNLVSNEEGLMSERHESYLWLLHMASRIIDCPIMELDKITVHLQKYFIIKMSGDMYHRFVCCQTGYFSAKEKRIHKELPFVCIS